MEKKHCLKMTTMTDLLLSRGSTKYKEQVEKLLESQPAVKKDRAGELALGNSFSRLGVQAWAGRGRGEMARVGRLRAGKRGRPGNSKNATLPARELFFLHFFCISKTGSHFLAFFAFPKPGVIFLHFFLHFLDRVCHLHRLRSG